MNGKNYDFRNDTGTYQTGRTQPPKRYGGLIAFLIALVILLSGISTALSIMNLKLYWQLNTNESVPQVAFSRSEDTPMPTEAVHEQVQALQEHLGISGTIIPEVYQRYYKLPKGIYVSQVATGSEAQTLGIVAGDIITEFGGHAIRDGRYMNILSKRLKPGDTISLVIYRNATQTEFILTWNDYQ